MWAEPWAYGELDLLPWEFWRLTPGEFRMKLAGYHRRDDRAWYHTGTLGTWVLSPWTKKRLTILGLLGRSKLTVKPEDPVPEDEDIGPSEDELEERRQAAIDAALAWAKEDEPPPAPLVVLTDKP